LYRLSGLSPFFAHLVPRPRVFSPPERPCGPLVGLGSINSPVDSNFQFVGWLFLSLFPIAPLHPTKRAPTKPFLQSPFDFFEKFFSPPFRGVPLLLFWAGFQLLFSVCLGLAEFFFGDLPSCFYLQLFPSIRLLDMLILSFR